MSTVIVLGYRKGLDAAVIRRGLRPLYVVEKVKPQLAGRDHVRVARMEDAQEVLRAVLAHGVHDVRAVVTTHEEAVFTVALLRAYLGAPGDHDYGRTLYFRDKYLQKHALPDGVPRARCRYAPTRADFTELSAELGVPFVVKPANGYGSARTSVIATAQELADYRAEGIDGSDGQVVAESFVPGRELHVDGVWQGGELAWSCLSRYADAPMSWRGDGVIASGPVDPARHPELHRRALRLTRTVLGSLQAPDTTFHLEAFLGDDGELTFGECAVRIAGGLVPEVIALTYGVDLYEVTLDLALGDKPQLPAQPDADAPRGPGPAGGADLRAQDGPDRYFGFVLLRPFPQVDLAEDDFRRVFAPHEISYDPQGRTGSYGRVGHAILAHPDSDELHRLMAEVIAFNRTGEEPNGRDSDG